MLMSVCLGQVCQEPRYFFKKVCQEHSIFIIKRALREHLDLAQPASGLSQLASGLAQLASRLAQPASGLTQLASRLS